MIEKFLQTEAIIQKINDPLLPAGTNVFVKRDDLIHPEISGNKWWKLKYNIREALINGCETLLTFGGAYSNHIAATAELGKISGLKTIGIIRGEELEAENPTLRKAEENGMKLIFISRLEYRNKNSDENQHNLKEKFGNIYIIPEGGKNLLGVKGCTEILKNIDFQYNYICCACGTGATLTGIALSKPPGVTALGFSALKGNFLTQDVAKLITDFQKEYRLVQNIDNWKIITDYHFGGYGKVTPYLIEFVNSFKKRNQIQLDYIYTGKMFYGIYDMINKGSFPSGASVLVLHSGGIQGNMGFK